MTITCDRCLVFGPTGGVGSHAALEAQKRGLQVFLAMRDTDKPIPILDNTEATFTRIKADLTDPSSCASAVTQSGAKAAYIYHVNSKDGMRSTLSAMKDAGLEYVVFLSTFSIQASNDIRNMDPQNHIPFSHAQTECALEDLGFKYGFVALRSGQLATNNEKMKLDKSTTPWKGHELFPNVPGDAIAPIDLGRVAGAVLASRPDGTEKGLRIYVLGPALSTYSQQWDTIKRVSGKDIDVINYENNPAGFADFLKSKGLPAHVADTMTASQEKVRNEMPGWYNQWDGFYDEVKGNVRKYSGYEPTSFEEYVAGEKW